MDIKNNEQEKGFFINDRIKIAITNKCNLSCFYCHNEGQPLDDPCINMKLDYIKSMTKFLVENNIFVKQINISGGEPLLHLDLIDIIDECKKVTNNIHLNTNAILLTKEKVDEFVSHGITRFKIGIDSLFQSQTKPNIYHFETDIQSIKDNLRYAKKFTSVRMNAVITDFNYQDMDKMVKFAMDLDMGCICLIKLDESAIRDKEEKNIISESNTSKYFFDLREKYLKDAIRYEDVNGVLSVFVPHGEGSFEIRFANDICETGACKDMFSNIDSNGDIMVCPRNHTTMPIDWKASFSEINDIISSSKTDMCNPTKGILDTSKINCNWDF